MSDEQQMFRCSKCFSQMCCGYCVDPCGSVLGVTPGNLTELTQWVEEPGLKHKLMCYECLLEKPDTSFS